MTTKEAKRGSENRLMKQGENAWFTTEKLQSDDMRSRSKDTTRFGLVVISFAQFMQQRLYFLPLPQEQGALRPAFGSVDPLPPMDGFESLDGPVDRVPSRALRAASMACPTWISSSAGVSADGLVI